MHFNSTLYFLEECQVLEKKTNLDPNHVYLTMLYDKKCAKCSKIFENQSSIARHFTYFTLYQI